VAYNSGNKPQHLEIFGNPYCQKMSVEKKYPY